MNVTVTASDLPPSVNNLYVTIPRRGRVKSKRYRVWCDVAGFEIMAQRPKKITGRVRMSYAFGRPKGKRKADLSNLVKAIEDLLVLLGIIEDDSLVEAFDCEWRDGLQGLEVRILGLDHATH